MREPKVYAIVLNWNRLADTLACVDSLAKTDYGDLHVVVVDNGSRSSPRAELERSHAWIEVLRNDVNLGYAGGNNVGLRHALSEGADYVWVLNNDTTVTHDALRGLVDLAERQTRAAAVGGRVYRADRPGTLWVTWGRVTWLQSLIALAGHNQPDSDAFDGEHQVEWLPGCSILFRADALREIGLFDEAYFAYHEDVDWAARARASRWQVWYTGASRIHHAVHASSGGEEASYVGFRSYLSARNSVLYAKRHGLPWQRALFAATILATLPFQYLRRVVRGQARGVALKIRGWRDALAGREIPFAELGLREDGE